jgi:hypothetical protein
MKLLTTEQVELLFSKFTEGYSSDEKSDCILSGTWSIHCPHCNEILWGLGNKPRILTDIFCSYCDEEFHYLRTPNISKSIEEILNDDVKIIGL